MSYFAQVIRPLPCCGVTPASGRTIEVTKHLRSEGYCSNCQTSMTRTFAQYTERTPTGDRQMLVPLHCIERIEVFA